MRRWIELLRTPGAARLQAASIVGRLAYGIVPLSLVLLAREHDHSYAVAGAIAGAYAITLAVSIPVLSRVIDRRGLSAVLLPLAAAFPAALVAPAFAAAYRMIDLRAPAHATTEAFGWTSTAIVAGSAAGSAAGGSLIAAEGTTLAFLAAAAAVLIALMVATARRRTLTA